MFGLDMSWPFLRIGEAVAYRYNALDVPGRGKDVPALADGLRAAFEGDDAVLDGDREAGRIGQELASDHVLRDLLPDVLVPAAVDAQHVGPANDPDQAAVLG